MFTVNINDIQNILSQFGIAEEIGEIEELLRYNYTRANPESKEVRLIIKCIFSGRAPLVIKFKNEDDLTYEALAQQVRFSEHLSECGIATAGFYQSGNSHVLSETVNGYEVFITVEDFCKGEIKVVNPEIAEKTGKLLAMAHNISERDDCHVDYPVLFDPFKENDLFSYVQFEELKNSFTGDDAIYFSRITDAYRSRMGMLSPLLEKKRYAVQGDISDCNLFITDNGEIGMFDFNLCGDSNLFCDAVMQGVFESRLMDYDKELTEEYSREIFRCFLAGYNRVRPFSAFELTLIPHLYAVITAFWLTDISVGDGSLLKLLENGNKEEARRLLRKIEETITADLVFDPAQGAD